RKTEIGSRRDVVGKFLPVAKSVFCQPRGSPCHLKGILLRAGGAGFHIAPGQKIGGKDRAFGPPERRGAPQGEEADGRSRLHQISPTMSPAVVPVACSRTTLMGKTVPPTTPCNTTCAPEGSVTATAPVLPT